MHLVPFPPLFRLSVNQQKSGESAFLAFIIYQSQLKEMTIVNMEN